MRRYAIIIEKSDSGYGAFVPDLAGCVAVGKSIQETERLIKEAIEFHLEGMKEDGVSIIDSQQLALFCTCWL
jgi:predicted RNase H-like HicB family nuclease